MKNPRTQKSQLSTQSKGSEEKTFIEHVQELRNRLFWIAVVFILASAAAYPFFEQILAALVHPLGQQKLYYLTPAGGFSFILKVCMYTGMVAAVPVVIYQIFRYIQPVMGDVKFRTIAGYISASIVLALAGIACAYFVSLPAALHFLTDFDLPQISAMLTADAYFSFVMTYLLAAAALFQLPLVMMIINNVTPLDPGSMMKKQRYVIVIAFIFGAIISPTPDALNQALLAGPIIVMYQLSVFLVLLQNWARRRSQKVIAPAAKVPSIVENKLYTPNSAIVPAQPRPSTQKSQKVFFTDVVSPARSRPASQIPSARTTVRPPARSSVRPVRTNGYVRSIDGFAIDA